MGASWHLTTQKLWQQSNELAWRRVEFAEEEAYQLAQAAIAQAQQTIADDTLTVEQMQDAVEDTLLRSPYKKTAKAYIIYRDQHQKLREIAASAHVDLIDQYLLKLDWRVNENSNMGYSLQGLNNYISSEVSKTYWLNKNSTAQRLVVFIGPVTSIFTILTL